ncbi:MAG: N(4)-(beta-N-acetylglucosaminyl)-L-asparaginase [Planctomycetota bacterium]
MTVDRRSFLAAAVGAASGLTSCQQVADARRAAPATPAKRPIAIATYGFARTGTERGMAELRRGGAPIDAVEQGIRVVEAMGNGSVGQSGHPNAAGYVQVDACIMDGPGHRAGSVGAVEGIVHPITAARKVMEESKHVMLVGEGARWFALEHGLESVDVAAHIAMKEAWRQAPAVNREAEGHDTVAMLVLGANGDVAGGCSTSGAGNKLPGRVGDSPILGSGLYVDNEVGAAGATGLGENIMRHCATAMIVELMRQGLAPSDACAEVIHRAARIDPRGYDLAMSYIALDVQGRVGAATTGNGFPYVVASLDSSEVHRVERVAPR